MKAWREVLAWGLVALGSLASPAAADEPRDDRVVVALRYEPHEGCPDADAFRRGVEARTSKVRWSEEGERRFRVVLTRREGLTHGQLEMSDADRAPSRPREVSDRGCEAVVDALALVAALAVDPMASYAPRPEPPEPPDENPPPKPSPDPEPGLGAIIAPVDRVPPPPQPPEAPPPEVAPHGRWRWLVGAQLQLASGLGSQAAAVLPLYTELALEDAGWLAPAFRLGIAWLPRRRVQGGDGAGEFRRFAAQASGCPVVASVGDHLRLRPCLGVEVGAIDARGVDVDVSQGSLTPWVAVRGVGRSQVFATDWLFLEAQAEVGVPLVRSRFLIEPDATVVEIAPVFGVFGVGMGVRTP